MKRSDDISARQLTALLFLALAVDLVVRPFTRQGNAAAQIAIPAAFLETLVLLAVFAPVLWSVSLPSAGVLRSGAEGSSKVFLVLCTVLFALGMGAGVQRAELFFRYVSDDPLPPLLVYALMFGVAVYAMRCGLPAVARLFGLLLWLFALSMALLLVANLRQMRLENLTMEAFSMQAICCAAVQSFSLSPVLALFFFLSLGAPSGRGRCFVRVLLALCAFSIVLVLCTELVLGQRAALQVQTVHTLSRLGRISVFKRLDALHIAAWMLVEFAKAAALGMGIQLALEPLLPCSQRPRACWYALAAGAAGALAAGNMDETVLGYAQTAGTAAVLLVMAMLGCRSRWAYEKTKT